MSQGGSSSFAAQTDGLFFYGSNDLGALLSRAVTDFRGGYYLLGWYPGEDAFKRKKREASRPQNQGSGAAEGSRRALAVGVR